MSATLGSAARVAFTGRRQRIDVPVPDDAASVPYPALTLTGNGTTRTLSVDRTGKTKEVTIQTRPWLADAANVADAARTAAQQGAKVLVIRNTVSDAQAVLGELEQQGASGLALAVKGTPAVHHSRFAVEDRGLLDDAVESALGKHRTPDGLVVTGTQTLEQSLDIDADLLITDICPVDVLLQRIGRLHRHERQRPAGYEAPRCVILTPGVGLKAGLHGSLMRHGLGIGSHGGGIYRDLLGVEQTRRLAVDHPVWRIPDMNRMLVERATNPIALRELAERLRGAWIEHERRTFGIYAAEEQIARLHCLDRTLPFDENLVFPDLDEAVRTRLGEDGPRFELAKPATGPFGTAVRTFNLPAHLFGSGAAPTRHELASACLDASPDGAGLLRVGSHLFRYDRLGIRRAASDALPGE